MSACPSKVHLLYFFTHNYVKILGEFGHEHLFNQRDNHSSGLDPEFKRKVEDLLRNDHDDELNLLPDIRNIKQQEYEKNRFVENYGKVAFLLGSFIVLFTPMTIKGKIQKISRNNFLHSTATKNPNRDIYCVTVT